MRVQITKRQVARIVILWLQAFISTFKGTSGSGKVTVQLVDYSNSESRDYNGDYCDNISWCVNDCDNYFQLCFAKTTSADKCALWKGWTTVLGDDSFSFPKAGGSLGNGIMNPLTYSFTSWQPILFSVEVWDEDTGSANDLVDRYSLSIQTTPFPSASTVTRRYKLSGKGYSYLNADVKVFCDRNYFIPDCSTFCTPRNDNTGHYTCDFTRGQKVCLSEWYGSDCITHCVSRNDTFGHYSCDANGHIKCLDNWYGLDCLLYCKPRNDSSGHYSCDVNGQRQCLSGWYGNDCLTYCMPRNDSSGHYSCDVNGQRQCLSGWYGNDCLTYCVSRNDSSGHYSCDVNGQRQCLSGWYGNDCLTYCVSRNDSSGHYSCDVNGQRQCLSGWYGNDCLTYCVSRNDSSGHYSCDVNGQRQCLSGWYGNDCLTYCVSRNDSSGHYSCDVNGQRQCLSGWYGNDCLTYCVSRNDSSGHYSCDVSGQRQCLSGWYSNDCLTYCVFRNDSSGHYSCDVNGQRQCLSGWYGNDCLTYCVSRNGTFGHYSCEANGQMKCLDNWYGRDCLLYCKFINDSSGHHSCDANGQINCQDNWYGSSCLLYCKPRNDSSGHHSCDANGQMKCLDNWYGKDCLLYCKFRNDSSGHYTCNSTGYVVCLPGWRGQKCTESDVLRATVTTSLTVNGSTKWFQHQISSSRVLTRPSVSSPKVDSFTLMSAASVVPLVTTGKEVIVQPTETKKVMDLTLSPKHQASSFQPFSQPSASSSQMVANTLTGTTAATLYTTDKEVPVKPSKTIRITTPSTFKSISGLQYHMPSSLVSSQPSSTSQQTYALTLKPSLSIGSHYTNIKELTVTPTKTTNTEISSTLNSILSQVLSKTRASNLKTSTATLMQTQSVGSLNKKVSAVPLTETTKVTISSTAILLSTPSVEMLCSGGNEITAEPTLDPEVKPSASPGILVEFHEKEGNELVVSWVIDTTKIVLAQQLNKICRQNAETCNLSEEDVHSTWFCPWDVKVEIHDVMVKGVSVKIASTLPSPLNGMVPSKTLMEILNKSREYLENATQADISWIQTDGLTTPRTRIYGKPDQLSRVAERQSTSPLPFIMGIAGAVLILAVVLFVVRAKVAKRNMIHPYPDDDRLSSPFSECQAESDTIVLLSRTKGKCFYKDKEKKGLNMDCGFNEPEAIEEIYL